MLFLLLAWGEFTTEILLILCPLPIKLPPTELNLWLISNFDDSKPPHQRTVRRGRLLTSVSTGMLNCGSLTTAASCLTTNESRSILASNLNSKGVFSTNFGECCGDLEKSARGKDQKVVSSDDIYRIFCDDNNADKSRQPLNRYPYELEISRNYNLDDLNNNNNNGPQNDRNFDKARGAKKPNRDTTSFLKFQRGLASLFRNKTSSNKNQKAKRKSTFSEGKTPRNNNNSRSSFGVDSMDDDTDRQLNDDFTTSNQHFYKVNVSGEEFSSVLEEIHRNRRDSFSQNKKSDVDSAKCFSPCDLDETDQYGNIAVAMNASDIRKNGGISTSSLSFDQCSSDPCTSSAMGKSSKLSIFRDNFNHKLHFFNNGDDHKSAAKRSTSEIKSSKNCLMHDDLCTNEAGSKINSSFADRISSKLFKMSVNLKPKRAKRKTSSAASLSKDSKSLTDLPNLNAKIQLGCNFQKRNSVHLTAYDQWTVTNSAKLTQHASLCSGIINDHQNRSTSIDNPKNLWGTQRPKSEHFNGHHAVQLKTRMRSFNHANSNSVGLFGRRDNYETLEKLGEGSYATVYKGKCKFDGSIVALKEIKINVEEGCPFTAIREASLLKGLQHSNIVLLHDIIYTKECLIFVFEYVQIDLGRHLERHPNGIHPHNVKLFLYQLLRGLAYCHDKKILHRDMKPQNLLISDLGELKIADFGLARAKSVPSHTYSHEVVTLWYRPPDVLLGSTTYSTSLDMWGVGCIFAELIMGSALFPGAKDVFDQLDKIFRVMGTPNENTWKGVEKLPNFVPRFFNSYPMYNPLRIHCKIDGIQYCEPLLSSFLRMKPEDRISAREAMAHAYFNDLPVQIHDLPHKEVLYCWYSDFFRVANFCRRRR